MDKENNIKYIQSLLIEKQKEIYNNNRLFRRFLAFMPKVAEYSYEEQLQLFILAEQEEALFSSNEWNSYGRIVTPGSKSYQIYDFETEQFKAIYGLSQTQGKAWQARWNREVKQAIEQETLEQYNTSNRRTFLEQLVSKPRQAVDTEYAEALFNQSLQQESSNHVKAPQDRVTRGELEMIEFGQGLTSIGLKLKHAFKKGISAVKRKLVERKERKNEIYRTHQNTNHIRQTEPGMARDGKTTPEQDVSGTADDDERERSVRSNGEPFNVYADNRLGSVRGGTISRNDDTRHGLGSNLSQGRKATALSEPVDTKTTARDSVREEQGSQSTVRPIDGQIVGEPNSRDDSQGNRSVSQALQDIERIVHLNAEGEEIFPTSSEALRGLYERVMTFIASQSTTSIIYENRLENAQYCITLSDDKVELAKQVMIDNDYYDIGNVIYTIDYDNQTLITEYNSLLDTSLNSDSVASEAFIKESLEFSHLFMNDIEYIARMTVMLPQEKAKQNVEYVVEENVLDVFRAGETLSLLSGEFVVDSVLPDKDIIYLSPKGMGNYFVKRYALSAVQQEIELNKTLAKETENTTTVALNSSEDVTEHLEQREDSRHQETTDTTIYEEITQDIVVVEADNTVDTHGKGEVEKATEEETIQNTTNVALDSSEDVTEHSEQREDSKHQATIDTTIHEEITQDIVVEANNTVDTQGKGEMEKVTEESLTETIQNTTTVAFSEPLSPQGQVERLVERITQFVSERSLDEHVEGVKQEANAEQSNDVIEKNEEVIENVSVEREDISSTPKNNMILKAVEEVKGRHERLGALLEKPMTSKIRRFAKRLAKELQLTYQSGKMSWSYNCSCIEMWHPTKNYGIQVYINYKLSSIDDGDCATMTDNILYRICEQDGTRKKVLGNHYVDRKDYGIAIDDLVHVISPLLESHYHYQAKQQRVKHDLGQEVAVGVGQAFTIVNEKEVAHIALKDTQTVIEKDGQTYTLLKGTTFEESLKVDNLLDEKQEIGKEFAVRDYVVQKVEQVNLFDLVEEVEPVYTVVDDQQNTVVFDRDDTLELTPTHEVEQDQEQDIHLTLNKVEEPSVSDQEIEHTPTVVFDTVKSRYPDEVIHETVVEASSTLADESSLETENTTTVAFEPSTERIQYAKGKKAKFQDNIEAIKTLQSIQAENRKATPEEKQKLSKYAGWGGLSEAFDKFNATWNEEYHTLKELVSEEQYRSMKESVLTAYYTDTQLIEGIYTSLNALDGFSPKRILDPSTGTGNFLSAMSWKNAEKHAVEVDELSGNIAKALYDDVTIDIKGFEKTTYPKQYFDLVVSNVPFNNMKLFDPEYKQHDFMIHDYFMAKSLDLLEDNGILAVMTSSGTMDKADSTFREYLAERAELIGAVRLPNTAFAQSAHTQVISDVLIFRKQQGGSLNRDWIDSVTHPDYPEIKMNRFFIDNPSHVLGDIAIKNFRGKTLDIKPNKDKELAKQLAQQLTQQLSYVEPYRALESSQQPFISTQQQEESYEIEQVNENTATVAFSIPDAKRPYTYYIEDNQIYYLEGNTPIAIELIGKKAERLKGMIELRQIVQAIIQLQTHAFEEEELSQLQVVLNHTYDNFVKQHGYLNENANASLFREDDKAALILSIEKVVKTDTDTTYEKADIFFKATIRPNRIIKHADSPDEALQISLLTKGHVDLTYMSTLLDNQEIDTIIQSLKGKIFLNPEAYIENTPIHLMYETAEEYLSGNVGKKLDLVKDIIAENVYPAEIIDVLAEDNLKALEEVQPEPLQIQDIGFQLGSRWIPQHYIAQFAYELFQIEESMQPYLYLRRSKYDSSYTLKDRGGLFDRATIQSEYGTSRINGIKLLEKALNMQSVTIYDAIDDDKRVVNPEQTAIAREKLALIEQKFQSWLFNDVNRAEELVKIYNQKFNTYVLRQYDGSHLTFDGMNTQYSLRPHQRNVVSRILYEGRALMAHEVGAGKTAAMITAGKHMKAIGMAQKPLYVVPNSLKVQWAKEFYEFFPNANVLLVTEKDFQKKNRKKFLARIATGNYDAVVMGESQFTMISLSEERQEAFLRQEIDKLEEILEEERLTTQDTFTIKDLQRKLKVEQARLERLSVKQNQEDLLTFEELGVDFLFVDEAHGFKNLGVNTRLKNVAGVTTTTAKKAQDMLMKVRYIQELQNGKGVVFATGTPISNSMTELYTMQRYLQPEILAEQGLESFDSWVGTFGQVESSIEINPEGEGYRIRQRLKKFINLPELMIPFSQVADIVTSDMMDLDVPELVTGKVQNIVSEKTVFQEQLMHKLVERASAVRSGLVDPKFDNMLTITNDGKLMAIDSRLIEPHLPRDPHSKIGQCVENVFTIWQETAENRSTQIIFSDSGVPKAHAFNVYDDIKDQLIERGVPEEEIAFVHDAKTDKQRDTLFGKVRTGEVRVIVGSTGKLGTGVNVQNKLIAAHHIDCPWKPSDLTQREGRILRQGNENEKVSIFRYITKGTFDSYLWQIQEQKLTYINQVMTGQSVNRSGDDLDETVLTAAEVKALATGNPHIAEKMEIDNQVSRLQILKKQWQTEQQRLKTNQKKYPEEMNLLKGAIQKIDKDIELAEQNALNYTENFVVTIQDKEYGNDDKTEAHNQLFEIGKQLPMDRQKVEIGEYRGFKLYISRTDKVRSSGGLGLLNGLELTLKGERYYHTELSEGGMPFLKLNNELGRLAPEKDKLEGRLYNLERYLADEARLIQSSFEKEEELDQLMKRQTELNIVIEMLANNKGNADLQTEETVVVDQEYTLYQEEPFLKKYAILSPNVVLPVAEIQEMIANSEDPDKEKYELLSRIAFLNAEAMKTHYSEEDKKALTTDMVKRLEASQSPIYFIDHEMIYKVEKGDGGQYTVEMYHHLFGMKMREINVFDVNLLAEANLYRLEIDFEQLSSDIELMAQNEAEELKNFAEQFHVYRDCALSNEKLQEICDKYQAGILTAEGVQERLDVRRKLKLAVWKNKGYAVEKYHQLRDSYASKEVEKTINQDFDFTTPGTLVQSFLAKYPITYNEFVMSSRDIYRILQNHQDYDKEKWQILSEICTTQVDQSQAMLREEKRESYREALKDNHEQHRQELMAEIKQAQERDVYILTPHYLYRIHSGDEERYQLSVYDTLKQEKLRDVDVFDVKQLADIVKNGNIVTYQEIAQDIQHFKVAENTQQLLEMGKALGIDKDIAFNKDDLELLATFYTNGQFEEVAQAIHLIREKKIELWEEKDYDVERYLAGVENDRLGYERPYADLSDTVSLEKTDSIHSTYTREM